MQGIHPPGHFTPFGVLAPAEPIGTRSRRELIFELMAAAEREMR